MASTLDNRGQFDRIGCPDLDPVFGRKVVEGQEGVPILCQTFSRLRILGRIGGNKRIDGLVRGVFRLRHPDLMECAFGLGLVRLWQLVQHVGRLVDPTPLSQGGSKDLGEGRPEPQGPIADRQLRVHGEAPVFEIKQKFLPGLAEQRSRHRSLAVWLCADTPYLFSWS